MAFEFKYALAGEEVYDDIGASNDSITKGDVLYWNSGYGDNTYANVKTENVAGVAGQTVDNSAGAAGAVTVACQMNPLAVYECGTGDTMAAGYVGYNYALASASTITSASQGTDQTGVFKILKMVSTSKVQGRLVFAPKADT